MKEGRWAAGRAAAGPEGPSGAKDGRARPSRWGPPVEAWAMDEQTLRETMASGVPRVVLREVLVRWGDVIRPRDAAEGARVLKNEKRICTTRARAHE